MGAVGNARSDAREIEIQDLTDALEAHFGGVIRRDAEKIVAFLVERTHVGKKIAAEREALRRVLDAHDLRGAVAGPSDFGSAAFGSPSTMIVNAIGDDVLSSLRAERDARGDRAADEIIAALNRGAAR
ncbi:MAG: hypothetical protein ABSD03_14245 [Vulcanimicrobiaceae bacterium]|jgi:chorismate mutase